MIVVPQATTTRITTLFLVWQWFTFSNLTDYFVTDVKDPNTKESDVAEMPKSSQKEGQAVGWVQACLKQSKLLPESLIQIIWS